MAVRATRCTSPARDTARLPAGAEKMERLARMLAYERSGTQAFSEDLARVMRRVRKVHERCFYDG